MWIRVMTLVAQKAPAYSFPKSSQTHTQTCVHADQIQKCIYNNEDFCWESAINILYWEVTQRSYCVFLLKYVFQIGLSLGQSQEEGSL